MLRLNPSDIVIFTLEGVDYSGLIDLLDNSVLDDLGYIKNACQRNKYYFEKLV